MFSFRYFKLFLLFIFISCSDLFLSEVDECGIPGGDNTSCIDECGVLNGDGIPKGYCDCEYNIMGCDGECGSEKIYDICGICNGSSMNESDCNCENILETLDCLGECGGTAVIDECGVCNGNNSTCTGCMIFGSDNYSPNFIFGDNEICSIDYNSSIQTVLDNHCVSCHAGSYGVNLESFSNLMSENIIIPGDSTNSLLWKVISGNSGYPMPPTYTLDNLSIHKIALWIQFGANQ